MSLFLAFVPFVVFLSYSLLIVSPFIFLTFVFPRLPGVITLHPNNTIVDRGIDYYYTSGLLAVGLILGIASYLMFRDRTRLEVLEHELAEAA